MASKTQFKGLGKGAGAAPNKTAEGGKGVSKESNVVDANKAKSSTLGNTLGKSGTQSLVQVIYNGKIVTPQSLLPRRVNKGAAATATVNNAIAADSIGRSPATMSRKKLSISSTEADVKHGSTRHNTAGNFPHSRSRQRNDDDDTVQVILSETNTNFVFTMKSMVVAADSRDIHEFDERNNRYEKLISDHKNAADNFKQRAAQTINYFQRNKNEATSSSR